MAPEPESTSLKGARKVLIATGATNADNDPRFLLYRTLMDRKASTDAEASTRAQLYRRWDNLYYPGTVTQGGPDHWPEDDNLNYEGRVHISLNTFPPYVDIPAHMQAIVPYMNAVPDSSAKEDQEAADRREKLFWVFWLNAGMNEKLGIITLIKSLYGSVGVHPFWDAGSKLPSIRIIETPENLRIGWGSSDFSRKDWALWCYWLTPQAVRDEFDLSVRIEKIDGKDVNLVSPATDSDPLAQREPLSYDNRTRSQYEQTQVAVYDFWYKEAKAIRHAVYVENWQQKDEARPEYNVIPFVWIPNGKIPGSPDGRSEFHDIEQLIREKETRMSEGAMLLHKAMSGPMWQLVGPNAPSSPAGVSIHAKPEPNKVALPGEENRIEAITPWTPGFDLEQYLKRCDEEIQLRSGLGPLQLGIAGSGLAGSSKAINAELAMYAPRIGLPRDLLFAGLLQVWEIVGPMWGYHDKKVARILGGNYKLEIRPPEITVRDDVEMSGMVSNLVQNRLMSIRKAMDKIGIDNPTEEIAAILEEQTNGALNPSAVMQQIQLIGAARSLQIAPQEAAAQQPTIEDQAIEKVNAAMLANNPPPQGSQSANQPGPPAANQPANAQAPNGAPMQSQTMLQNGEASGRILSSTPLGG